MSSEITKAPEERLTERERAELTAYRRTDNYAPLAPSVVVRMYTLYLLGHSCEEIVKANDNHFSLGMVLDARVRHDWDRRRDEYVDQLHKEAGNIVRQRQIESALFLGDMLAVAHIEYGAKFQKFMQSRDPKDLPETFKADSITKYKMVIDALMRVTGQDKKEAAGAAVQVIANNAAIQETGKRAAAPAESFDILRMLAAADAVEGKKK